MTKRIHAALLEQFAEFMAIHMGLGFPKEKRLDLLKGIYGATKEFGFEDPEEFLRWIMSSPLKRPQIEKLASQFTVGETYFFREPSAYEALETQILPELIRSRWEANDRRLRIWSAGCCTGEEPYSIAIMISRLIPDLKNWNISILATDINPQFLQKAQEGIYREWSFRGTPYWLKENYFIPHKDGSYEILPQIKRMVKFQYLNLVEDVYPSLFYDTNAMDVIFCRNVLMYFTQEQMAKVVERFYHCLLDKGWLVVGSSECSHVLFPQFVACSFPGAILYHKDTKAERKLRGFVHAEYIEHGFHHRNEESQIPSGHMHSNRSHVFSKPVREASVSIEIDPPQPEAAVSEESKSEYEHLLKLYEEGQYEQVISKASTILPQHENNTKVMALLAKAYANQGKLNDAIFWCEKAIAVDKLNPEFHHLRAIILQEQGQLEAAIASLRRALYLDSNFVLAHFMLGNLAQQAGRYKESRKYFENALSLLSRYDLDVVVDAADGLTAGRLKELILLMLSKNNHNA